MRGEHKVEAATSPRAGTTHATQIQHVMRTQMHTKSLTTTCKNFISARNEIQQKMTRGEENGARTTQAEQMHNSSRTNATLHAYPNADRSVHNNREEEKRSNRDKSNDQDNTSSTNAKRHAYPNTDQTVYNNLQQIDITAT